MSHARVLVVLLLLAAVCAHADTDYFAPENLKKFAESLYSEGDFLRAAGEYQRYLLVADATVDRTPVLLRIGQCFRQGGEPLKAAGYFTQVLTRNPDPATGEQAATELARAYFDAHDDTRTLATLDAHPAHAVPYPYQQQLLRGLVYVRRQAWVKAVAALTPGPGLSNDESAELTELRQMADKGAHLHYKSRLMAGVLSALLPGAGKLYAGRPKDALGTLMILGSTSYLAYRAFQADGRGSAWGWVYGAFSAGLYAGDIYGAAVAVQVTNDSHAQQVVHQVEVSCGLPL